MLRIILINFAGIVLLLSGITAAEAAAHQANNNDHSDFRARQAALSINRTTKINFSAESENKSVRRIEKCSFFNPLDVVKITGEPLPFLHELNEEGEISCTYYHPGKEHQLIITFQKFPTLETAQKVLRLVREIAELKQIISSEICGCEIQTVSGIGDAAWIETSSKEKFQLIYVRRGKVTFSIEALGSGKMSLAELKQVARKFAGRFQAN